MESADIIKSIENNLFLPKDLYSCEFNPLLGHYIYGIGYGTIEDCSILSCGCCLSESLFNSIIATTHNELILCPTCKRNNVSMIGPVQPLRSLFNQLETFRKKLHTTSTDDNCSIDDLDNQYTRSKNFETMLPMNDFKQFSLYEAENDNTTTRQFSGIISNSDYTNKIIHPQTNYQPNVLEDALTVSSPTPQKKTSLLNLFYRVSTKINNETRPNRSNESLENKYDNISKDTKSTVENSAGIDRKSDFTYERISLTNKSNTIETEWLSQNSETGLNTYGIKPTNSLICFNTKPLYSPNFDEKKESYFTKCFPLYRKRYVYKTHTKFLKTKSKLFINSAISPDCKKYALISKHKWEVYSIPEDIYKTPPSLLCCGCTSGEYGPNFDQLKPKDTLKNNTNETISYEGEYVHCKLSQNLLIISDTNNSLKIIDVTNGGEIIHFHNSKYPIRCIDIDPGGKFIACGIIGKDRKTNSEQALISLHKVAKNEITSEYEFALPITIALPYRDPINTIQLSSDASYLSCSTAMESRFLIISLRNVNEPRLLMKSLRSIDTSLESEGITDTKLFPGNSNLMCVTSTAFDSPPIIINTNIEDINNLRSVAQPSLLNKIFELGCKIHKCEISPRNDSIAFLDKNGSVYIMCSPTMVENETKQIVLVETVADAYRAHESASMRFSADGYVLYILDRKGVLYVEDFAYDIPQNREIIKCKEIN